MRREKTRISSWKRTEEGSVGFRVGSTSAHRRKSIQSDRETTYHHPFLRAKAGSRAVPLETVKG
jgi:hypothetical protein